MKECPFCKHLNDDTAKKCQRCGVSLSTEPLIRYIPAYEYHDIATMMFDLITDPDAYDARNHFIDRIQDDIDSNEKYLGIYKSSLTEKIKEIPKTLFSFIIGILQFTVVYILYMGIGSRLWGQQVTMISVWILVFGSCIWGVLKASGKLRRIFRSAKQKQADENVRAELNELYRKKENLINENIEFRKNSMAKVPFLKPEYWNKYDLQRIRHLFIKQWTAGKTINNWDSFMKQYEKTYNSNEAALARKRAATLPYKHEVESNVSQ